MADNGKGYIEDRRPASNVDPYAASGMIFDTGVLKDSKAEEFVKHYMEWVEWLKKAEIQRPS